MENEILLKLPEVIRRVGLRKSSLYALMARGEFPAATKIGRRAVAWPASEIEGWIRSRINAAQSKKVA